ncbi:hypothetical protein LEN26_008612 [Aphanomyces euteiches]|nr:hypothetical protein AeMF1_017337 [Aphanomyces euteiches]KAH9130328.1 hypothetical protein LEN26_008612 [Aphanomyces euteiches]KAH9197305.1 hypothetical protein AeNC1_000704 [Aphanomyces euteiches]
MNRLLQSFVHFDQPPADTQPPPPRSNGAPSGPPSYSGFNAPPPSMPVSDDQYETLDLDSIGSNHQQPQSTPGQYIGHPAAASHPPQYQQYQQQAPSYQHASTHSFFDQQPHQVQSEASQNYSTNHNAPSSSSSNTYAYEQTQATPVSSSSYHYHEEPVPPAADLFGSSDATTADDFYSAAPTSSATYETQPFYQHETHSHHQYEAEPQYQQDDRPFSQSHEPSSAADLFGASYPSSEAPASEEWTAYSASAQVPSDHREPAADLFGSPVAESPAFITSKPPPSPVAAFSTPATAPTSASTTVTTPPRSPRLSTPKQLRSPTKPPRSPTSKSPGKTSPFGMSSVAAALPSSIAEPPMLPEPPRSNRSIAEPPRSNRSIAEPPRSNSGELTMQLMLQYKKMAERLEAEKNELLGILMAQADQFYAMQAYIDQLLEEKKAWEEKALKPRT